MTGDTTINDPPSHHGRKREGGVPPPPVFRGPRVDPLGPSQHEPTQHGRIPVLGVRGVGACVGVGVPVLGVAMSPPAHQPTSPPAHNCQYHSYFIHQLHLTSLYYIFFATLSAIKNTLESNYMQLLNEI